MFLKELHDCEHKLRK